MTSSGPERYLNSGANLLKLTGLSESAIYPSWAFVMVSLIMIVAFNSPNNVFEIWPFFFLNKDNMKKEAIAEYPNWSKKLAFSVDSLFLPDTTNNKVFLKIMCSKLKN